MANFTVTESDRIDAEKFIEEVLLNELPDADISKGSSLRDFLITGISCVVAALRNEIDKVKIRQSLKRVKELGSQTDIDEAVDGLLSNLFITRKSGKKVNGTITIHLSQSIEVLIRAKDTFTRSTGIQFTPDSKVDIQYTTSDLTEVRDSANLIKEYTLRIPVIAAGVGGTYNISSGNFSGSGVV